MKPIKARKRCDPINDNQVDSELPHENRKISCHADFKDLLINACNNFFMLLFYTCHKPIF